MICYGTIPGRRSAAALLLLLLGLLLIPSNVRAAHYFPEGRGCYACHSLDQQEAEDGTSLIASVSRTMPLMKLYNGGSAPANFGCTYCHNSPANTAMRDALSHFGPKASKHPVGYDFWGAGESNNEYLSTIGSAVADQVDCVDCHDPDLLAPGLPTSYVGHVAKTVVPRSTYNPYMLRSITASGQYDPLCRGCHGAGAVAFKGRDVRVKSHADASAPIQENDGTSLRTTALGGQDQCRMCHDTHYSTKVKLFNDGHEGDTAITSTNCTSVCHYRGDASGNYDTHGHGRGSSTYKYKGGAVDFAAGSNYITMGMGCTACHYGLDTSDTSTARKAHVENPTGGTIQDRYKAKYNLNLPLQSFDTGSIFGSPQSGVCYSCHATYDMHVAKDGEIVGCQDCHDEHAEGSGTGSNYFMIPEVSRKTGSYLASAGRAKAGTEPVIYNMPRRDPVSGALNTGLMDFYSTGGAQTGVCDNAECHPGYTPVSGFMATTNHSGGAGIPAGNDCEGCHKHNGDPEGGWRASASCSSCHSMPGATAEADHVLSGAHNRHAEAAPAGKGYACKVCHNDYPTGHNTTGYNDNTNVWDATVLATSINLRVDTSATSLLSGATNLTYNGTGDLDAGTTGIAGHNGVCANLYCHGGSTTKQTDWAGADETPAWSTADPGPLGCGDCHADPPATPAASGAHTDHMAVSTYVCGDCHGSETATTHVNGSVTLAGGLSYTGGLVVGDNSYGSCSTGSCHNATAGTNVAWNATAGNCNVCHYRTAAGPEDNYSGNDKVASMVVSGEWVGYGHGKTSGPSINRACTTCHSMGVGHDFTTNLNGAGNNPYRLRRIVTPNAVIFRLTAPPTPQ